MNPKFLSAVLLVLFTAADLVALPLEKIQLPPGFVIELYAGPIEGARSMALGPEGIVFVGSNRPGKVYALIPNASRTQAKVVVLAEHLKEPNGVAYRKGALYVGEISRILRYDNILQHLDHAPAPVVIRSDYPTEGHHGWKVIRFGPDGKLYVPVGMPCNVCEKTDPFGTMTRLNADGSALEIFARGIRNTVGFDWDPATRELWFTDNGRDLMGDDLPPDELNHAPQAQMNFGFPYCQGGDIKDPEYGDRKHPCSDFTPPAVKLGPHVASLGMRFYTGKMFPESYRGQIFIAEHGSWNRTKKIGYRISLVRHQGAKVLSYETFAQGWLQDQAPWGRPVDVQVMPDGALLVSDDYAGAVYRITYRGKP